MIERYKRKIKMILAFLIIPVILTAPLPVSGEVAPIEETKGKIENISGEEMKVLEKLFLISKEIEALEKEETKINNEIGSFMVQIADLEEKINQTQQDYTSKLEILEQVLVYYQRGGPATYLDILLNADSFSEFLKSLNAIKDISHNVAGLLTSLEEGKKLLQEEKQQLDDKVILLENKQLELDRNLLEHEVAAQEQESYLSSLEEDRIYYEEQLLNLQILWEDCKKVFQNTVTETTRIIGEGYYTADDLNLGLGIFTMPGALEEDTFNRILNDNSDMTETYFRFNEGEVVIEVPELHLVLHGNFFIADQSAIQYEVTTGTFYELPLDELSIQALFEQGPLIIDFAAITGGIEIVDFSLEEVASQEGRLTFVIKLQW
ncbi:MAG: hypothetical protein K0R46_1622 [Herbinix sp.]|nr:hypothetical protein [Herbinix sp.]